MLIDITASEIRHIRSSTPESDPCSPFIRIIAMDNTIVSPMMISWHISAILLFFNGQPRLCSWIVPYNMKVDPIPAAARPIVSVIMVIL